MASSGQVFEVDFLLARGFSCGSCRCDTPLRSASVRRLALANTAMVYTTGDFLYFLVRHQETFQKKGSSGFKIKTASIARLNNTTQTVQSCFVNRVDAL